MLTCKDETVHAWHGMTKIEMHRIIRGKKTLIVLRYIVAYMQDHNELKQNLVSCHWSSILYKQSSYGQAVGCWGHASWSLTAEPGAAFRWIIPYALPYRTQWGVPAATVFIAESRFTRVASPITTERQRHCISLCGNTCHQGRFTTLCETFCPKWASIRISDTIASGSASLLHDADITARNDKSPGPTGSRDSIRVAMISESAAGCIGSAITILNWPTGNIAANVVKVCIWASRTRDEIGSCIFDAGAVRLCLSGAVLNPYYQQQ